MHPKGLFSKLGAILCKTSLQAKGFLDKYRETVTSVFGSTKTQEVRIAGGKSALRCWQVLEIIMLHVRVTTHLKAMPPAKHKVLHYRFFVELRNSSRKLPEEVIMHA